MSTSRAIALVLTITKDNVDELNHLSEYTSLVCLNCTGAGLTHLPPLPETLQILLCSNNNLKQLPLLPASLTTLECNGNCFPNVFRSEPPQNIRNHQLHEIEMQKRQNARKIVAANQPQTLFNQLRELNVKHYSIDIDDVKAKLLQAATKGATELVYEKAYNEFDNQSRVNGGSEDYVKWADSIETWFNNAPECRVPYSPFTKLPGGRLTGVRFTWA